MKILIQHRHTENEISGVLTYINLIVPELQAKGIEVEIISTKDNDLKKWLQDIAWADIVHMNSNHLGFALACKALGKTIVVKYHYLFYQSIHSQYETMTFSQRLKTELIYSLPKPNYPLKWKLYTGVKWARLATRMTTALLADRHTACSDFLAESLAFPGSVSTLYNPIKIQHEQKRKSLADLSHPYSFVFVGRLDRDKGADILLKSAAILQACGKEFQVVLVGDGSSFQDLKQLASDLKIIHRVKFLGKIPNPEVISVVSKALALVAPSRWQDPAPYVALEAASVQTCPIVSKVGGLPEMVGSHGLLFDSEDVESLAHLMAHCLEYPEEALDRGLQVSKYVATNFSPATAVAQLIEICQEISHPE